MRNLPQEASFGREVLSLVSKLDGNQDPFVLADSMAEVVRLARDLGHGPNKTLAGLVFHAGEVQDPDQDLPLTYSAWVPESPEAASFFEGVPEDEQGSLQFCVEDFKGVRIFITFEDYKEEEPLCPGTM